MSATQSIGAKSRWDDCRIIADHLGCGKTHVHDKLYSRIKRDGRLDAAKQGDSDTIAEIKSWPEFTEESVRMYDPIAAPVSPSKQALERVKLAFWFIEKMGGADKAIKAIELAQLIGQS